MPGQLTAQVAVLPKEAHFQPLGLCHRLLPDVAPEGVDTGLLTRPGR